MCLCSCVLYSPEGEETEAAEGAMEEGFGAVGLKKLTVFVKKTVEFVSKSTQSRYFFTTKQLLLKNIIYFCENICLYPIIHTNNKPK